MWRPAFALQNVYIQPILHPSIRRDDKQARLIVGLTAKVKGYLCLFSEPGIFIFFYGPIRDNRLPDVVLHHPLLSAGRKAGYILSNWISDMDDFDPAFC
jgi:hypothetical protein